MCSRYVATNVAADLWPIVADALGQKITAGFLQGLPLAAAIGAKRNLACRAALHPKVVIKAW